MRNRSVLSCNNILTHLLHIVKVNRMICCKHILYRLTQTQTNPIGTKKHFRLDLLRLHIWKREYSWSANILQNMSTNLFYSTFFFSLHGKEDDAWVWTNHLYKRMSQLGRARSSGHDKQKTPRLLGTEWTIYVLHNAGHIPLYAALFCKCGHVLYV